MISFIDIIIAMSNKSTIIESFLSINQFLITIYRIGSKSTANMVKISKWLDPFNFWHMYLRHTNEINSEVWQLRLLYPNFYRIFNRESFCTHLIICSLQQITGQCKNFISRVNSYTIFNMKTVLERRVYVPQHKHMHFQRYWIVLPTI